jgi:hypothetical protein
MSKLSKSSKNIQKKWQDAAEARGGKNAKIVVAQSEAKELIFNLLGDSFRPMNITEIYEALKATVPSPVLKSCLDAMSVSPVNDDGDSDDDDLVKKTTSNKKKKVCDKFTDALRMKAGRNTNTTLYYMNHSKLTNGGNGLDPEQRNELVSNVQKANEELKHENHKLQTTVQSTTLLLSEPLNKEAAEIIRSEESCVKDLEDQLKDARKLKSNESSRKATKRKTEQMLLHWRKRSRLCMDFLSNMEECTEGTISVKKCLTGSGQIDIESDENAVKEAKEMDALKKKRKPMKATGSKGNETKSSPAFIAVTLGPKGVIQRVYTN